MSPLFIALLCFMTGLQWLVALTPHLFPMEVYYLKYGNLMNLRKTFLPMDGTGFKEGTPLVRPNITMKEALSDDYMIHNVDDIMRSFKRKSSGGHDGSLYDQLNFQVLNATRKRHLLYLYSLIGGDWYWYDPTDPEKFAKNNYAEKRKRAKLNGIALTWLLHTRYLVDKAMKLREPVRNDSRYQLGYLFNRLRRLKTEMLKMVRSGYDGNKEYWTQRVMLTMRIYEEVIKMDTDVRDTTWLIRKIAEQIEPDEEEEPPVEEKKKKNKTKT